MSKTSYFLCYDPPTIKRIFERLRNFDSPGSYPAACGTYSILHVRDVTTGYDSSQLNKKSVSCRGFVGSCGSDSSRVTSLPSRCCCSVWLAFSLMVNLFWFYVFGHLECFLKDDIKMLRKKCKICRVFRCSVGSAQQGKGKIGLQAWKLWDGKRGLPLDLEALRVCLPAVGFAP